MTPAERIVRAARRRAASRPHPARRLPGNRYRMLPDARIVAAYAEMARCLARITELGHAIDVAVSDMAVERDRVITALREKAQAAMPQVEPTLPELTVKEKQVARLLVGTVMSCADIGRHLYVSVNTVKTHQKNLYAKLGIHRRAELVDFRALWTDPPAPSNGNGKAPR